MDLSEPERDLSDMSFDFVDVNPALSGMAAAAESLGGTCVGVLGIGMREKVAYEEFHGRGATQPPKGSCALVVAELPFSAFAAAEKADPAVLEHIKTARSVRGVKAVLFRIPWKRAARVHVHPSEFEESVERVFEQKAWHVTTSVSDDRNDLFVAAVARDAWNGGEPLPAVYSTASFTDVLNPQKTLSSKGYPANLALHYADYDHRIVMEAVSVYNAKRALAQVIGSIGAKPV